MRKKQNMSEGYRFIRTEAILTTASYSARTRSSGSPQWTTASEQRDGSVSLKHKHLLLAWFWCLGLFFGFSVCFCLFVFYEKHKLNLKHLLHCTFQAFYSAYPAYILCFPHDFSYDVSHPFLIYLLWQFTDIAFTVTSHSPSTYNFKQK